MKSIYIAKIDTKTDWFDGAINTIEAATNSEADWDAIDNDSNSDGYLAGYYRKDGTLYRARFEPSRSDSEQDCVTFEAEE